MGRNLFRRGERLYEEPVKRLVGGCIQRQRRQIDLGVPECEELEIRLERLEHGQRNRRLGAPRPPRQAVAEFERGHERPERNRPTNAPRTAMAAGVMPGILNAWPSVSGLTCVKRCTTSRDRPGTRSKGKSSGMMRRSSF